jgi:xylulokinase
VIRLVGSGALAPLTCQIMADVLGREIETVESPQNVGAVGAVAVAAVGLGIIQQINDVKNLIRITARYKPDRSSKAVHDRNFEAFKALYKNNRKTFGLLNNTLQA